jgi:hypothetical protein
MTSRFLIIDASCAGLTRASIEKKYFIQGMDCRVKPGNDPVYGQMT